MGTGFPKGAAESIVYNAFRKFLSDSEAQGPSKALLVAEAERVSAKGDTEKAANMKMKSASQSVSSAASRSTEAVSSTKHAEIAGTDAGKEPAAAGKGSGHNVFSTYNGGCAEKYRWHQTLTEVGIQIDLLPVAGGLKLRGKDVLVQIKQKKYISVGLKGKPLYLEGELHAPAKFDEYSWSLEDGRSFRVFP